MIPACFARLVFLVTSGAGQPSEAQGIPSMIERFISFSPMAYPPCRLEFVHNPKDATQKCFTTADDVMLADEERCRHYIVYIVSDDKIAKHIDTFLEGECTNKSCPLQKNVLYCRFSIGDLSDEEVDIFEYQSDIANHPDFVLQSKSDISLDSRKKQFAHRLLLDCSDKLFESYCHNPRRYDLHSEYMAKLKRIAETIIESRSETDEKVKKRRSRAERVEAIKKTAKEYWIKKVNGELVSQEDIAKENGFEKEPNILSKSIAEPYMTKISQTIDGAVAVHGAIQDWDARTRSSMLTFIYDTLK